MYSHHNRHGRKAFLVADMQIYKRLCPLVRLSVGNDRVKKWKNKLFGYFLCMFGCGRERIGVWMGVGRPCPPVRNDIVTPRHLLTRES